MVEDRLMNRLTNMGYRRIDSNAKGIYLFYRTEVDKISVVSVMNVITGEEVSGEQYKHIIKQMKDSFNNIPQRLELLSLIFTGSVNRAKILCTEAEEDSHWIVDINENRLIIYETQTNNFVELREEIERFLQDEEKLIQAVKDSGLCNQYGNAQNYGSIQRGAIQKIKLFTLINTSIIIVNIIVFLLFHYTKLFGGEDQMLEAGALSWYFVKEEAEYYRLITSMFMHFDWGHLFNNMLILLFVGSNLERATSKLKYLFIYFGTGIIAGITSISYNMWKDYAEVSVSYSVLSIGASGAIFGVVGAMLYIVIVNRGRLEDISTRQMILFILFSLYGGILNARIDQAAHIGGFIAGLILAAVLYRRPKRSSEDL